MPQTAPLTERIFQAGSPAGFNKLALEVFHFQIEHNKLYRSFVSNLSIKLDEIKHFTQIPFLPIGFFKSHTVMTGVFKPEIVFTSSGTTGQYTSRHMVKDAALYRRSFSKAFSLFFGAPDDYVILALLPSYLEREGSSLIYMVEALMEQANDPDNGYYLSDYAALHQKLMRLTGDKKKVILFGVSYALLDLAAAWPLDFPELIIIETGGMKGRRREMVRDELHMELKQAFGVAQIFSEYGMTELLSQAWSIGGGLYATPSWMKVLIRDTNDPGTLLSAGKTGGINVIDLANVYSCSFISTQDLGKLHDDGCFEVLGRFDNSDIRGCNLLVEQP